ncbi:hypothetical protein RRG08_036177 [Elysia crispata]|uniref:Uncharacterized protein n=1 Tax=Elysia crispata TaxID=231223 RepID=A0AAE0XE29_9GAST|nr:hypothetical protein RRG08_036177 [Elysia crispata]
MIYNGSDGSDTLDKTYISRRTPVRLTGGSGHSLDCSWTRCGVSLAALAWLAVHVGSGGRRERVCPPAS